jgi:glucokinase
MSDAADGKDDSGTVLAVDVGGTKLASGIVDREGNVVRCDRVPTPSGDGEAVWETLVELVDRVRDGAPVAGCGVGCGGPMRWPAGEVSPLNIPGWRDFPLRERLVAHLGCEVRLHNDAVCLAVAEHWRGAARGHDNTLGMVVSTGVGGGLILGGRLIDGATGNAGHVGHVVVDPDGPACSCGGRGCLEAVASGPRLTAWARQHGWTGTTAVDLAGDARAGDATAQEAFRRAGHALGVGIASVAAVCDLSMVVVGGGVMGSDDLLRDALVNALRAHARLDFLARLTVVAPALGEFSGLVGAAAMVLAGDRYWSGQGAGTAAATLTP